MNEKQSSGGMLKDLVERIVKHLVDKPEMVVISEISGEQATIVELRVAPEDLGKVIGKEGRTARSIRTLVHAAATKENKRALLDILE
jgi:predicted RNA-binding protein YlqC (UPF0109 family)